MRIRLGVPGDEADIHEAHMRSIREICAKDHGPEEIRGWGNRPIGNRWIDAVQDGQVWVVEENGKIHGHGHIRISAEEGKARSAHIYGLYLTPEAVGRGLGLKLAQLMIAKAQASDAEKITLESTLTAHKFYQSLGFVDDGPLRKMEIAGYPVSYYPMSLALE